MIKIVLVDDHVLVRNGIKMLLDIDEGLEVVGEFGSAHEAISFLSKSSNQCDIVITDISMPEMDGFSLAVHIQQNNPSIQVVLLSMLFDLNSILQAFNSGVKGYLLKSVNYKELLFALNHIHRGGKYLCDELNQKLIAHSNLKPDFKNSKEMIIEELKINDREMQVLTLIGEGLTNKEIADTIFLTKRTIEGLRHSLIYKTGTKNSASLIKFAILNRLIE